VQRQRQYQGQRQVQRQRRTQRHLSLPPSLPVTLSLNLTSSDNVLLVLTGRADDPHRLTASAKLLVSIGEVMAKVKVRKINREELPGIVVLRDAVAADLAAFPSSHGTLDLDMEIDPNLRHLLAHDPDGFFTAFEGSETLGFAASHVRSRQCVLPTLPRDRGHSGFVHPPRSGGCRSNRPRDAQHHP
jgi:hypothetical protein